MQPSKIVSKPSIFSLNPCHIGFVDNLVTCWNEARINRPSIGDVEIVLPCSAITLIPLMVFVATSIS